MTEDVPHGNGRGWGPFHYKDFRIFKKQRAFHFEKNFSLQLFQRQLNIFYGFLDSGSCQEG